MFFAVLRGITAVLSCLNAFFQRQLETAKTETAEKESMKEPLLGDSDQVDLEANRHGADTIENTPELAESGAALLENQENQETHEKLENLENQENQETHETHENLENQETHENQETQEEQETDETLENQGNKETHENQENQETREHIDPGVRSETAECTEEVHDVDHFEEGEKDVEKPSQEEVLPILEGEHFFQSHMIEVQEGSVDHERIEFHQERGNADGEICVLNQPKMDQEVEEHLETAEVSLPSDEGVEQLQDPENQAGQVPEIPEHQHEDSTVHSAAPELVEELIEKDETIMVLEAVAASSPTENCGDLLENEENTSHLQVPAVVDKEAIPAEMPEAECFEPGKPAQLSSAEAEAGGTYTFAISTCILYTVVYLHTVYPLIADRNNTH